MLVCEHSSWQFLAVSSNVETELLTAVNGKQHAETYSSRKSLRTLQNVTGSVMVIAEISVFPSFYQFTEFDVHVTVHRDKVL